MKIATYNVNGVNGPRPVLLRWLTEAEPDIVVLQELKAPQSNFPAVAIRDRLLLWRMRVLASNGVLEADGELSFSDARERVKARRTGQATQNPATPI